MSIFSIPIHELIQERLWTYYSSQHPRYDISRREQCIKPPFHNLEGKSRALNPHLFTGQVVLSYEKSLTETVIYLQRSVSHRKSCIDTYVWYHLTPLSSQIPSSPSPASSRRHLAIRMGQSSPCRPLSRITSLSQMGLKLAKRSTQQPCSQPVPLPQWPQSELRAWRQRPGVPELEERASQRGRCR